MQDRDGQGAGVLDGLSKSQQSEAQSAKPKPNFHFKYNTVRKYMIL